MEMAQSKDDSTRKYLCHSLGVEFGEHCTTLPTRKLILYPNELLIDMLIVDNLVPRQFQGSKSKSADVQQSSLANTGWYHRVTHE